MRRRDLISLVFLGAVIFYSWQKLLPPPVEADETTVDQALIDGLSPWSGPIAAAQPTSVGVGTVKGSSSEAVNPTFVRPSPLLPVEEYHGSVFHYSLTSMLAALQVTINGEDVVEAFPDPAMGIGSVIKVYRATPVEVTDWGKPKVYRTWKQTVADFLAEQGLELGDNDRINPSATSDLVLTDGMAKLVITRVAITEVKVKEKIDFKKIEREDPELPRGQVKTTAGVAGERTKTFRVTRENGLEVKREQIDNKVTKEPKDETRIVGTKVLIGKSFTGRASWYKYNSTKVATDHFKRGTQLRITNLDNGKVIFVKNDGCICADTGYVVDLHPDHFTALGGVIRDGVMKRIKVDEILN